MAVLPRPRLGDALAPFALAIEAGSIVGFTVLALTLFEELGRHAAHPRFATGEMVAAALPKLGAIEAACGAVALVVALNRRRREGLGRLSNAIVVACASGILLSLAASFAMSSWILEPLQQRIGPVFDDPSASPPERGRFARWHGVATLLFFGRGALALVALHFDRRAVRG